MYSSYTTLQRVQLAKQEYLDTQEVFLGVYAPGRNAALKASLQDQLLSLIHISEPTRRS